MRVRGRVSRVPCAWRARSTAGGGVAISGRQRGEEDRAERDVQAHHVGQHALRHAAEDLVGRHLGGEVEELDVRPLLVRHRKQRLPGV